MEQTPQYVQSEEMRRKNTERFKRKRRSRRRGRFLEETKLFDTGQLLFLTRTICKICFTTETRKDKEMEKFCVCSAVEKRNRGNMWKSLQQYMTRFVYLDVTHLLSMWF